MTFTRVKELYFDLDPLQSNFEWKVAGFFAHVFRYEIYPVVHLQFSYFVDNFPSFGAK